MATAWSWRSTLRRPGGFQTGNTAGSDEQFSVIAVGDMLRARRTGWQLESAEPRRHYHGRGWDRPGPGGGEFAEDRRSGAETPAAGRVPGFLTIAATETTRCPPSRAASRSSIPTPTRPHLPPGPQRRLGLFLLRPQHVWRQRAGTWRPPSAGTIQAATACSLTTAAAAFRTLARLVSRRRPSGFPGTAEVDSVTPAPGGDFLVETCCRTTTGSVDTTQQARRRTTVQANQGQTTNWIPTHPEWDHRDGRDLPLAPKGRERPCTRRRVRHSDRQPDARQRRLPTPITMAPFGPGDTGVAGGVESLTNRDDGP